MSDLPDDRLNLQDLAIGIAGALILSAALVFIALSDILYAMPYEVFWGGVVIVAAFTLGWNWRKIMR